MASGCRSGSSGPFFSSSSIRGGSSLANVLHGGGNGSSLQGISIALCSICRQNVGVDCSLSPIYLIRNGAHAYSKREEYNRWVVMKLQCNSIQWVELHLLLSTTVTII